MVDPSASRGARGFAMDRRWLRRNAMGRVRVLAHCDEGGSDQIGGLHDVVAPCPSETEANQLPFLS